ncbi:hypothetical protein FRC11_001138, partial [Ceratobasidium sp. 423]
HIAMISAGSLHSAVEKARKNKKGLQYFIPGLRLVCDCKKCWPGRKKQTPLTIANHRKRNGVHPDSHSTSALAMTLKPNQPPPFTETSISGNIDGTSAPGNILDDTSNDTYITRTVCPGDPNADAVIFGSLLTSRIVLAKIPPLRLRGGRDLSNEEDDDDGGDDDGGDGGSHEGSIDGGQGDGDNGGPNDPGDPGDPHPEEGAMGTEGGPQHEPPMQVPPDDAGGEDPGDRNEQMEIPALEEHPMLRNLYLRIWVQYAFEGATQVATQAALESHKSTLLASVMFGGFPLDLIAQIHKMPTTL